MNHIKELREKMNLGQKELAQALEVSQPTVSDWENGRKKPSAASTEKLAEFFSVTIDFLLGKEDDAASRYVRIPVLGKVQAGYPTDAIEEVLDYEEIPADWTKGGAEYFALQIRGRSMEPQMREGDTVIVRRQPDIESGNIAVVLVAGEDATVKLVKKLKNGLFLQPFNPDFEPFFYSDEEIMNLPVTILGRVVESRARW